MHVFIIVEEAQHRVKPRAMLRMSQANQGFDATRQVPDHQVGRTNEVQRLATVEAMVKPIDARVFEIPPEHRTHRDVL